MGYRTKSRSSASKGSTDAITNGIPREVLPVPDHPARGTPALDARDARFERARAVTPPKDAANVLVVLLDDVGFGAPSAFGGPCETPVAEGLAAAGLSFSRFHTTALCSPTRMALLTGRNHHSVGMGVITELATSAPGYCGMRPNSASTIAQILRMNGFSTSFFGKCHEVPVWETSVSGPFDRWPTLSGFDKFYGFLGGETNQWAPTLYDGVTQIEPPDEEGYHFTTDMTKQATSWLAAQQALTPDKPFFMYFAPGGTHAPHHVPRDWIARYRGRFDRGWDEVREETLVRQKGLGLVPEGTRLTPRPEGVRAWETYSDDEKLVFARLMEVYAAFLSHTDHHVGLLVDAMQELGVLENTLVLYILGDNGASAEGTLTGTMNELMTLNGWPDTIEHIKAHLDDLGGPYAYNHYPVGWAHAMCTPYQWTKQVASHFGGTRNGMVVHWPAGIRAKGEVRHQFHHVIDVAPTILEATGLPEPEFVNGIQQKPIEGVSMAYCFDDADAKDRHTTQYFEMFGNRGIYHDGWTAVTKHRTPWQLGPVELPRFTEDRWELYDTAMDWSQAEDLAARMPEKLEQLKQLWLIEAAKYQVLPLDDRAIERANAETAGRPDLVAGRTSMTLVPGMTQLQENTVPDVKNKSHSVTAKLHVADGGSDGVIVAQGGRFGGWTLYVKDRRPVYEYNCFGIDRRTLRGDRPLPRGDVTLRFEFDYDGGAPGSGGTARLLVNGQRVAEGRIDRTVPFMFSADETLDVGVDLASPVTEAFTNGDSRFAGELRTVTIDVGSGAPMAPEEVAKKTAALLVRH